MPIPLDPLELPNEPPREPPTMELVAAAAFEYVLLVRELDLILLAGFDLIVE